MRKEREIDYQRDNIWEGKNFFQVFPGPTVDLKGQRGVSPAPAPDRELTQTVVKQIKSKIYGGW